MATSSTIEQRCGSRRGGSGLVNLKATLLEDNGTPLPNAELIEGTDKDAFISGINIPMGSTSLKIKLEAESQDPAVTGNYYRCGVHFRP